MEHITANRWRANIPLTALTQMVPLYASAVLNLRGAFYNDCISARIYTCVCTRHFQSRSWHDETTSCTNIHVHSWIMISVHTHRKVDVCPSLDRRLVWRDDFLWDVGIQTSIFRHFLGNPQNFSKRHVWKQKSSASEMLRQRHLTVSKNLCA